MPSPFSSIEGRLSPWPTMRAGRSWSEHGLAVRLHLPVCGAAAALVDLARPRSRPGRPSNDFGDREPGSSTEIKTFCEVNIDVGLPVTEKVHSAGVWLLTQLGATAGSR